LRHLLGLPVLNAGVKILFVLANDHHVHDRMFGFHKGVVGNAGANVSKETERLAHRDIQTLVAATLWRSDWRLEKNFGATQGIPGARLYARTISSQINFLADVYCFYLEVGAGFFENVQSRRHDLRPDTVAVCDGDGYRFGHIENKTFRDWIDLSAKQYIPSGLAQAITQEQSVVRCQWFVVVHWSFHLKKRLLSSEPRTTDYWPLTNGKA
jgi:hypothetical protein